MCVLIEPLEEEFLFNGKYTLGWKEHEIQPAKAQVSLDWTKCCNKNLN